MTERKKVTVVGVVLSVLLIGSQGLGERVALAGALEPPGPPSPTMKTLEQTSGAWDRLLPADDGEADGCNSSRFTCVMGGAAVLDKETGLVWEQSPATITHNWASARMQCAAVRTTGGRRGWRLPSMYEQSSLYDPGNGGGNPDLPAGHPFSNVQNSIYWSATTSAENPTTAAWFVNSNGGAGVNAKASDYFVWCVRSGSSPLSEY